MQGIADKVRIDSDGEHVALRFILRSEQAHPVAVELRGESLSGVLDDGDEVRLEGLAETHADGLHRPQQIANRTTGSTITARTTSPVRRGARQMRTAAVSAAVGSVVTSFLKPMLDRAHASSPRSHGPSGHGALAAKALVVVTLVGATGAGVYSVAHGVIDTQTQVRVVLPPSRDATGYSVSWTRNPAEQPDATPELPGTAGEARSPRLAPGTWYLRVRTIGGRDAGAIHRAGPFHIAAD